MIRRFLIVMLTMLVWSVQTVDAAVCNTKSCVENTSVADARLVADETNADEHGDASLACGSSCICHALHHGYISDPALALTHPAVGRSTYSLADCSVVPFAAPPPVRPPLA